MKKQPVDTGSVRDESKNPRYTWLGTILADDRRFSLIVALLVGSLYTLAYLAHPDLPGNNVAFPTIGWWGWWDQSQYLKSALALNQFALTPETYWYPLGYPLLGALFVGLVPKHAFFFPNLFLVLAAALLFCRIAERFISRLEILVLGAIFIASHAWLLQQTLVVPWNTIGTQATIYFSIWVLLAKHHHARGPVLISAAMAATYLLRPSDVIFIAPILAMAIWRITNWRDRVRTTSISAVILVAAFSLDLIVKFSVFGALTTPYDAAVQQVGFFAYPISWKLYWIFIDPSVFYQEDHPAVLFRFPWLALAPASLWRWAKRDGIPAVAVLSAIISAYLLYLAFNDFAPNNIYRFLLIHYLTWTFPLLFLITYYAISRSSGIQRLWVFAGASMVFILALFVRLGAVPASGTNVHCAAGSCIIPTSRPLMIIGEKPRLAIAQKYSSDGKELSRFQDFQVPYESDDLRILLSTRASGSLFSIEPFPETPPVLRAYEFEWGASFDPSRFRSPAIQRLFMQAKRDANINRVDLTGPQGKPDGLPDNVIVVTGPEAILDRPEFWEIHLPDSLGAWSSSTKQTIWWPIKVVKSDSGKRQLYFPDNGHFLLSHRIEGKDALGRTSFSVIAD